MKYLTINDAIADYIGRSHSHAGESIFAELRRETARFGDDSVMQIPDHQGTLLTLLTRLIGATSALEIGTFTGHSSICIARGLTDAGRLICLDMSVEWTDMAQEFWKKAAVDHKIELRIGDALNSIAEFSPDLKFDFVHIDAEKTMYDQFYEAALPHVKTGGVIVFDNMLRGGEVVEEQSNERTEAVKAMNKKLVSDPRVESVLIEIGDGIQLCRKQ